MPVQPRQELCLYNHANYEMLDRDGKLHPDTPRMTIDYCIDRLQINAFAHWSLVTNGSVVDNTHGDGLANFYAAENPGQQGPQYVQWTFQSVGHHPTYHGAFAEVGSQFDFSNIVSVSTCQSSGI